MPLRPIKIWSARAVCAAALCLGWACSGEGLSGPEFSPGMESGIPLRFGQGPVLRGAVFDGTSFRTGDVLGVLGHNLPSPDGSSPGGWNDAAKSDFMYNVALTCQGASGFTYSPEKYWPVNPNDRIKFFAYYPFTPQDGKGTVVLSAASQEGYPTIVYTPDTEVARQADLMCAVTEPLGSATGKVSFSFRHVLTQVGFSACHTGMLPEEVSLYVDSVGISGVIGSMTGRFTATGFDWAGDDLGRADYTVRETTGNAVAAAPGITQVFTSTGILLMIPQDPAGCRIDIFYSLGRADTPPASRKPFTHTFVLEAGQVWSPAGRVEYQLSIPQLEGWTEEV